MMKKSLCYSAITLVVTLVIGKTNAQIMVLYSNYICVTIKEIGGEIVKTHKYWAVGALACMVATFYTGFRGKMKEHKIFAIGAMGCMLFSVLSGYKMISVKGAVKKSEEVEKNQNIYAIW